MKTPLEVWNLLLQAMCEDNGVIFKPEPSHFTRAEPYIITLQQRGFFADDPNDLEGSFWQMAAGEEDERREFFRGAHISFEGLNFILNDIFDGPCEPPQHLQGALAL